MFLRTPKEIVAGPYIDDRGREHDCAGMVEGPDRYSALGVHVNDVKITGEQSAGETVRLWRTNMEADVIELLAGPYAEARYRKICTFTVFLSGGEGDLERAQKEVADFGRDDAERRAIIEPLHDRAARLVRRPPIWAAILALADALLRQGSIEGEEATEMFEHFVNASSALAGRP